MTTLNLAIAGSTGDADQDGAGNVSTSGLTLGADLDSTSEWVGLRFTGVGAMAGGTVLSATVDVIPTGSAADEPLVTIWAKLADPGNWVDDGGTGSAAISTGSKTTASVSWSNTNLGANGTTRYSSPDISSVVSEVVNQSGWSDTAIAILIQGGATSTRDLSIKAYDDSAANAATLTIEFVSKNTQRLSMTGCG